jgi:acetyltransferase-like isoleucine patch superfamily enzyme
MIGRICGFFQVMALRGQCRGSINPIRVKHAVLQKLIGVNRQAYWPMHHASTVVGVDNVYLGRDVAPGYMAGCYVQGIGRIEIGDYTEISGNVAILTANHDFEDLTRHNVQDVRIGAYCWLGFNVVVLPGVTLGDHTVVGAGAVVTKSFPEGCVVLAGNPARVIKTLDIAPPPRRDYSNHGFLTEAEYQTMLAARDD